MQKIETRLISYAGRIREADAKRVSALAESIKEVGLLNPITVYATEIIRAGQTVQGFGLIAGMHRLRACQGLGWSEIPATVVELGEQERIIAECDENLCVAELSPSDRAVFTAKRKAAYLALHPETGHGKASSGKDADIASFADDQAAKTGQAKRTVQLDAERGEKVSNAALAMIRGTRLDTGRYLDDLKAVSPEKQVAKVKEDLRPVAQAQTSRASKIDADVKGRAAKEVAEMIAEHVPSEWWDGIKANLYAAGANNIAAALTNITGEAVMDRRFG